MNTETVTAQNLPVGATIIDIDGRRYTVTSNVRTRGGDFRKIGFGGGFTHTYPVLHNFTVANFTEPSLF